MLIRTLSRKTTEKTVSDVDRNDRGHNIVIKKRNGI